ncbi:MAG: phosphate transport system substrate-binding protein [Candidatus Methanogaster sp.]|nr:MAG: phosphate transport system substrate-binding protein [ANME-2 cluster archaeon]
MNIRTRIKDMFTGMWEDTRAVSPIVATLVLVVVAITGAAAVGTIMGTFSSDVSEESNTGELADASSTEILIAGSTTVQPVSELLAEAYMGDHQGVKITVQGGGSGAGVSSAGMDIVDIGAASRPVKDKEMDKYPDLQTHQIGGSAVVVIANGYSGNITKAELNALYNDSATNTLTIGGNGIADGITVVQRSDKSGTEETFEDYLSLTLDDAVEETTGSTSKQVAETGNAGVHKKVQDTPNSIGFVDYGFAVDESGNVNVNIMSIEDGSFNTTGVLDGDSASTLHKDIKTELKKQNDENDEYIEDLTRPLNYLTNGVPNSMEQAFITFAMSPGATTYFEECGYFAVTEFA